MAKIRVHELAKEFGIASKEMATKIIDLGYNIKNYMSTLEDYEVQNIRRKLKYEAYKKKKEQEVNLKTKLRRKRRTFTLKKIIHPTESEEKVVIKPPIKKVATTEQETERDIPSIEEEKKTKVEQAEIPEENHLETKTEKEITEETEEAEKTLLKKKSVTKKIKADKRKSFVKIIDRPKIELPQHPQDEPKIHTTQAKKSFHDDTFPAEPSVPLDTSEVSEKKGRKRGKRVVDVTEEFDAPLKKRRIIHKKKEKQKQINKFLEEDIDVSVSVQKKTVIPKTHDNKGQKKDSVSKPGTAPTKASKRKIIIYDSIQVGELARRMGIKASDLIMKLMELGVMATFNQSIDYEVASIVASEFDYEIEKKSVAEDLVHMEDTQKGEPILRPPVVTIMGHVDHGKTSLLDAIRKADVASKEAGGITQHIGAYHVTLPSGQKVVFLDTPGHEAFTAMRSRGARITDIVILLVAADDGVMAQTREAIDHARAAKVPIIVAINKIDKPGANPEKVKRELAELGLIPEEWGGDTICINISAKEKTGIEELLEMMVFQAEVMELKADPKRPARGHAIEARLDKGRGAVATLLISEGTLHVGDALVCGIHHGRVRAMFNDKGEKIKIAGPSMPVEIQGLSGVPDAGNEFTVLSDDKKAREISEYRQRKSRETELAKSSKVSLENVFEKLQEQELKELNIVLKVDVQGSVEALLEALNKLSTQEIRVNFVRTGIGAITESDVLLASASDAIIIGFNVKPSPQAKILAEQEHVDIRFYDVIYHAIEEIKSAMAGLLEPVYKEKTMGRAEVRDVFRITKVGTVAGSYVLEGLIPRNAKARLLRDNIVVYNGKIASLRRFKEDIKEVRAGYECGIGLESFNDIKKGDIIEAFVMEKEVPVFGEAISDVKGKEVSE
jgi:translation initiation factor IF-2